MFRSRVVGLFLKNNGKALYNIRGTMSSRVLNKESFRLLSTGVTRKCLDCFRSLPKVLLSPCFAFVQFIFWKWIRMKKKLLFGDWELRILFMQRIFFENFTVSCWGVDLEIDFECWRIGSYWKCNQRGNIVIVIGIIKSWNKHVLDIKLEELGVCFPG